MTTSEMLILRVQQGLGRTDDPVILHLVNSLITAYREQVAATLRLEATIHELTKKG